MWWRFAFAVLATYRLAQFIVLDDGPFDLMLALRRKLGRYDFRPVDDKCRVFEPAGGFGRFLECIHCVGKWAAIPFALLALLPTLPGDIVLVVVGLAGAQSLIEGKRDCHKAAADLRLDASRQAYKAQRGNDDD